MAPTYRACHWSARTLRASCRWRRRTTWSARARGPSAESDWRLGWPPHRFWPTTAIGAALGAGGGKLVHHKAAEKIGEQAGETIPLGGAGLIVVYSKSEADRVEPAVTRAVQKQKGEAEGRHVQAVKGALADAQQKMSEECILFFIGGGGGGEGPRR